MSTLSLVLGIILAFIYEFIVSLKKWKFFVIKIFVNDFQIKIIQKL